MLPFFINRFVGWVNIQLCLIFKQIKLATIERDLFGREAGINQGVKIMNENKLLMMLNLRKAENR
jgi:hypothetical protein